ncbi:MAG: alpha/beta fold hydrolase [Acidobacteria bacterium]|nr:alpha/beta fold hydrolase [Acidobacteriota bacterium]
MILHVTETAKDQYEIILNIPSRAEMSLEPEGFHRLGKRVEITVPFQRSHFTLKGQLDKGQIRGQVRWDLHTGDFRLFKVHEIEHWIYLEYQGTYQTGDEEPILFFRMRNEFFCLQDQRIVTLYPLQDNEFISEENQRVIFFRDENGHVTHAIWQTGSNGYISCVKKVFYQTDDMFVSNGDVELSGTLYYPPGRGPVPAVVVVHGSGPEDRSPYVIFADQLVRQGIAVFIYDKRGVGASTGDRKAASFEDLANDALAAVRHLKKDPRLDPAAIGLWGISQGGMVVVNAVARSREADFALLLSCPMVTPAEQHLYMMGNELQAEAIPAEEVLAIKETWRKFFYALYHGADVVELRQHVRQWSLNKKLRMFLPVLPEEWARIRPWYSHLDVYHDPVADLRRSCCPVLFVYGEKDRVVPVYESAARVRAVERVDCPHEKGILFLPAGNHNLFQAESGGRREWPRLRKFVPDLFQRMAHWIHLCQGPGGDDDRGAELINTR